MSSKRRTRVNVPQILTRSHSFGSNFEAVVWDTLSNTPKERPSQSVPSHLVLVLTPQGSRTYTSPSSEQANINVAQAAWKTLRSVVSGVRKRTATVGQTLPSQCEGVVQTPLSPEQEKVFSPEPPKGVKSPGSDGIVVSPRDGLQPQQVASIRKPAHKPKKQSKKAKAKADVVHSSKQPGAVAVLGGGIHQILSPTLHQTLGGLSQTLVKSANDNPQRSSGSSSKRAEPQRSTSEIKPAKVSQPHPRQARSHFGLFSPVGTFSPSGDFAGLMSPSGAPPLRSRARERTRAMGFASPTYVPVNADPRVLRVPGTLTTVQAQNPTLLLMSPGKMRRQQLLQKLSQQPMFIAKNK